MKKLLTFLLSISALLSFVACADKNEKSNGANAQLNAPADFLSLKQVVNDVISKEGAALGIDASKIAKIPALYEVELVDFYLKPAKDANPTKYIASDCGKSVGYDDFGNIIKEPSDKANSDCFAKEVGDDDLISSELREIENVADDYDISELSFAIDNDNNIIIRARIQFETEGEYASSNIASEADLSYIFLEYPIFKLNDGKLSLGSDTSLNVWLSDDMNIDKTPKSTPKKVELNNDNLPQISFLQERDGDKILVLNQELEIAGRFISLRIAGEFEGVAQSELENKVDGAATKYFKTYRDKKSRK